MAWSLFLEEFSTNCQKPSILSRTLLFSGSQGQSWNSNKYYVVCRAPLEYTSRFLSSSCGVAHIFKMSLDVKMSHAKIWMGSYWVCPYLHLGKVGEVSGWDLVLLLHLQVDLAQVRNQLFLLRVLSKHTRHFLLQRADNVRVHLKDWEVTHFSPFPT